MVPFVAARERGSARRDAIDAISLPYIDDCLAKLVHHADRSRAELLGDVDGLLPGRGVKLAVFAELNFSVEAGTVGASHDPDLRTKLIRKSLNMP